MFIPISLGVNLLDLGYIWNIIIEIVLCVGVYVGYMFYTKDPLVEILLNKLGLL